MASRAKRKNAAHAEALLALAVTTAFTSTAFAQEEAGLSYGMDAELRYDDNIFRSDIQEVDSLILQGAPFVKGTLFNKGNSYEASYRLVHAEYFDSSDDNYSDHEFKLGLNHRFATKHAVTASIKHSLLTEQRGTGFSEEPNPLVDGPDDYDATTYDLTYFLGAPSGDLRFEFNANRNDLNFDSSYVGDTRDYEADLLGALVRYRVGAKTDLLLEYRNLDVKYDNTPLDFGGQAINLDSDEDYYLAGLAWDLSAKTKGEVKLGHSSRDYDDGGLSTSDFHWEVELSWRPKSYSEFLLNTGRMSMETYGTGLFINVQKHTLAWNHAWNSRLASKIEAGVTEDTYEDSDRVDDQLFWQAGLSYELSSWITLGAGFQYRENDSTFQLVNYDQNILYINTKIEL